MKFKTIIIVLFTLFQFCKLNNKSYAQTNLDSILYKIEHSTSDTSKLKYLVEYSDYCEIADIPEYTSKAIELADHLLEKKEFDSKRLLYYRAMANNNNGFYYHFIGNHRKSISHYNQSLSEFKAVPDSNYMALVYNNLAMVYNDLGNVDTTKFLLDMAERICLKHNYTETIIPTYSNIATFHNRYGDYAKSIEYSTKLLKIHKNRDDIDGIVHTYNNLSSIYYVQNDFIKAEEYILKALSFEKELENTESQATYLYNLSTIQDKLNKDSLAFENAFKSLKISKKIDNIKGIGDSYKLIGSYYFEMNEYEKALAYNDSSFNIYKDLQYLEGLSSISKNKATVFMQMNQLDEAKASGELSLKYANQLGYPSDIKHSSFVLSKVYTKIGDYKKAYEMLELYHAMNDSIAREEKINETYKLQIDLEYSQKAFEDSLKNANEKELAHLKLSEKNAQLEKEQTRNTALVFGVLLLLGSVIYIVRAYNKKKELAIAIAEQKEMVEQKNKEITDSINYASKIQQAILTSKEYLDSVMKSYFIFYKPKDIVSGDFYWVHETENNKLIVAVVDCTGHGVPGAFMSMIGNSLLNEIIIENKFENPGEILNQMRLGVIKALSQSGKEFEQRDGMDMSLFVYDKNTRLIEFSGANNPLWIVSNNIKDEHIPEHKKNIYNNKNIALLEIKPNKFPIGIYVGEAKPFDTLKYQLNIGDTVYMGTDGFADQFGGDKNKKYKYKTLKLFLMSINDLYMKEQKKALSQEFINWMADNEQIDDVCNFGFKVE